MTLSTKELTVLLTHLSEDTILGSLSNVALTLEGLTSNLYRHFTKSDNFRVGTALVLLIQEKDLLPASCQRIAALYLLFDLFHPEPIHLNPFISFFLELLQPTTSEYDWTNSEIVSGLRLSIPEKTFLFQLLTTTNKSEISKKAPNIISTETTTISSTDIAQFVSHVKSFNDLPPSVSQVGYSILLPDIDLSGSPQKEITPTTPLGLSSNVLHTVKAMEPLLCNDLPSPLSATFEPGFIRPPPPLILSQQELLWMNPTECLQAIQWDNSMCMDNRAVVVRKLLGKAFKESLTRDEEYQFTLAIEKEPKLVLQSSLTPTKLPLIVENNPTIAIFLTGKLTNFPNLINEYLETLVSMEMSLHSIEVLNNLSTTVDFPTEFLQLYITRCLESCQSFKDRNQQQRCVRLVCVFLQCLIRNKKFNPQDMFAELQAFCIEFSRIREAAGLFRLLKNMDTIDNKV